ncbi:unnamed protein product [Dibothriocephalus latus]|uniref:Reverse transcriptase domain-containing protein n=1 Tax=Dibothriocephalus latus TaxID=60516 RepID=A0A3P7NBA5_DIBLA|nr:unnamed protein product [Dibothriocephalus latus]
MDGVKDLGTVMLLLDVSSLFTNVLVTERVNYFREVITSYQQDIEMRVNTLKELLLTCTWNVQFPFDSNLHKHLAGIAMGSPLGPLPANICIVRIHGPGNIPILLVYYR